MATGLETLESIDQAMREVRQDIQQLDREIESTSERFNRINADESECFRELAKLRLDDLTVGNVGFEFDATDQKVTELLGERQQALAALKQSIADSDRRQSELEAKRAEQLQHVHTASETLDRREAQTQQRLAADPDYTAQLETAQRADEVAKRAEMKAEQAQQDRMTKGMTYEADPLFVYLWKRGYGTSEYSANPFFRMLDGWVARLCRYQGARPNYAMLLEIPKRLTEHAGAVRTDADREFAALGELEEQAQQADGIPALNEKKQAEERRAGEIDAEIKQEKLNYSQLLKQNSTFAGGEDRYSQQSLQLLISQFQREPLDQLRREAEQTAIYDDNLVVQNLAQLRRAREQLEAELSERKQLHLKYLERVEELEKVRWDFKRHRYDDVHSDFPKGAVVGAMLNEFLRGIANSGQLWNTIEKQHHRRKIDADPGFGSGGFGHSSGSRWNFPNIGGSFGGGSRKSGGGGGGSIGGRGGFRTGGGF